jgi:DNA-binding response OmpR family regulator
MKLLLLEDDRDARQALAALLSLDGFEVLEAADEPEFLQATRSLDIGAVIFDLRLGEGRDAVSLVMDFQSRRTTAGHAPARLICLTGSMDLPTHPSLRFPLCAALRKPAEYAAILGALRTRTPGRD